MYMMRKETALFSLFCVFKCSLSCSSSSTDGGGGTGANNTNVTDSDGKSGRHKHKTLKNPIPFGGFGAPDGMPIPGHDHKSREKAYAYYKNITEAAQGHHKHKYEDEDKVDPNWPSEWQGLGPSNDGQDPPPWAYVPKNPSGTPSYCFQPPLRGACAESLTRWAYNPYTNTCDSYTYSGCEGSQNNFEAKEKCEKACMEHDHAFEQDCDPDSHIYVDDIISS